MFPLLFLLLLLSLASISSGDEQQLEWMARALFREDLYETRINSDLVDRNISHCHNIYRRYCPKDLPDGAGTYTRLTKQIIAAEVFASFNTQLDQKKILINNLRKSAAEDDRTNYKSYESIEKGLAKIGEETLINFFGTPELKDIVREKIRTGTINSRDFIFRVALDIAFSTRDVVELDGLQIKTDKVEEYLRYELMMHELAQRHPNREKGSASLAKIFDHIIEEYQLRIKEATWSSVEDRFGNTRSHILIGYIRNISYAIAFANEYSIYKQKVSLIQIFGEEFFRRYDNMSAFAQMPQYRFNRSYHEAIVAALTKAGSRALFDKLNDLGKYAQGYSTLRENDFAAIILNHHYTVHAALTSRLSSLIGKIGLTFSHEFYHHIQFAHDDFIEDQTVHKNAYSCVKEFVDSVCDRFIETSCRSANTGGEDTADIYGVQIAYNVLKKMLGEDIDKVVLPESGTTNRQLFFKTIPITWCREGSEWNENGDVHNGAMYRVLASLGQIPDYKRVFGCYDDDLMVFPESSMCPLFSENLAR